MVVSACKDIPAGSELAYDYKLSSGRLGRVFSKHFGSTCCDTIAAHTIVEMELAVCTVTLSHALAVRTAYAVGVVF